jgi:DNA-directed RNA polymerase specialized sigma24 family protein
VNTTIARSLERLRPTDGPTDSELLAEYRDRQNGDAFATLVRRYAPLVWSVCHRVVGEHHTAEDAFQATFLVLARIARRIHRGDSVGSWL